MGSCACAPRVLSSSHPSSSWPLWAAPSPRRSATTSWATPYFLPLDRYQASMQPVGPCLPVGTWSRIREEARGEPKHHARSRASQAPAVAAAGGRLRNSGGSPTRIAISPWGHPGPARRSWRPRRPAPSRASRWSPATDSAAHAESARGGPWRSSFRDRSDPANRTSLAPVPSAASETAPPAPHGGA